MSILRIIAAVLLPPLGVFLIGGISRPFWITTGLTMLGFVPGIVFALYMVVRSPRPSRPPTGA